MIDFTSIIKGQRAARQDNDRDLATRRAEEKFAFERDQRMIGLETQQWDRQAASYAAPLLSNMQQAADAGQDDVTFLINQRKVVQEDPAFQAFPPEVQQRVLKQLGEAAQITAQQRLNAGDPAAARELYKAFGWQGQIPTISVAGQSGDIKAIIQSVDPNGTMLVPNPDGTYSYNGVAIPADRLAAALQAGGGAAALPAISATIQAENARITQATQQQQQNQLMLYQQSAMAAGFLPQPDGTFVNPTTGAVYPPMPGSTPAATDVIQLPGNTLGPQIAAPVATPVAAGATPAATALPAPLALPAAPATPVVPVLPAAAAPEVSASVKALQDYYSSAAVAEQALPALQKTKQDLEAYITSVTDLVPAPGFGPGGAAGAGNTRMIRQPKPGTDQVRYRAAITQLGDVTTKIQDNQIALKTARDNGIPAELQKLGNTTPAQYGQQLMQAIAASAATPAAAKATVKQSPAAAGNYLRALTLRLAELQGQPGTEKEAAELIEARANLVAALADARPSPNRPTGGGGR